MFLIKPSTLRSFLKRSSIRYGTTFVPQFRSALVAVERCSGGPLSPTSQKPNGLPEWKGSSVRLEKIQNSARTDTNTGAAHITISQETHLVSLVMRVYVVGAIVVPISENSMWEHEKARVETPNPLNGRNQRAFIISEFWVEVKRKE